MMRLITIFIIAMFCCLLTSGQKVSIDVKQAPVEKVFKEIEKQAGYYFTYTREQLKNTKPVTITVSNASIIQVLDLCVNNQPVSYEIRDRVIIIKEKLQVKGTATSEINENSATIDLKGRITNENGEPVAASITVKKTQQGTTTNEKGEFEIKEVSENAILVISGINIEIFEIKVKGKTSLSLMAKTKVNGLEEVVVNKGYYTEKQKLSVSNVGRVTAKDIEKQPVQNPLLALQGRVPGLFILQPSGIPGSGVKINIQGKNSIANGNNPLYVIDGVPIISEFPMTGIDGVLGGSRGNSSAGPNAAGFGNPLNYLDMADIESIEVLKDADATAIYGSRAANGAILITTKKGKVGPMRFDLNMQTGWGQVAHKLDMLDTRQYLDMRYEAYKNDGIDWRNPSVSADDLKVWDTTRYTDWQKALIGGTAKYTTINATVSGGTDVVRYLIGTSFQKQTTVFPLPGNFADQKGSVNFNLNANSPNQKLRIQFTGSYLYDRNQLPSFDMTEGAVLLEPNAPALYNPDGSINWAPDAAGRSTFSGNPMVLALSKYWNKTSNLVSNLTLNYKILPTLDLRISGGYNKIETNDFRAQPMAAVIPEGRSNYQRGALYGSRDVNSWIIEPQASYRKNRGKNSIELLAGATLLHLNTNAGYITGKGHLSDDLLENMFGAATLNTEYSEKSEYKYAAAFGRVNYNWDEKYIINFSGRRDGSSRFGSENSFHNFGSVGIGWIFTKENFIAKKLPFLSFGKLRGSYGTTGNDQIGDYSYLSLYGYPSIAVPYQGVVSIMPSGLPNPHLQWEETKKLQLGVDLSFMQDKISINVTYVRNRSSNQLLSYSISSVAGFSSYLTNFSATIQNRNWEFFLNSKNVTTKTFTWATNFNLTIPENKLLSFPGLESSSYATELVIGEPDNIKKVLHFIGVDPETGKNMFDSKTNNFNPQYPNDYTSFINTNPTFYGGLQNSFTWKGIELDVLLQFVKQLGYNDIIYWNGNRVPGSFYVGLSNQPTSVLSRWQNPGDVTNYQKFTTAAGYPNTITSDQRFTDASYIRLKNVSLSWELPQKWTSKIHFTKCRVYVHGQNLWTYTKYKGLDPENQSILSPTLPPLRVVMVGVQIGL